MAQNKKFLKIKNKNFCIISIRSFAIPEMLHRGYAAQTRDPSASKDQRAHALKHLPHLDHFTQPGNNSTPHSLFITPYSSIYARATVAG